MKKILLTAFVTASVVMSATNTWSFVRYEEKYPRKITELNMTGYADYAPLGWIDAPEDISYGKFNTVFTPMIDDFIKEANLKMHYNVYGKNVDDLTQKVRQGEIDFFVGAYSQTELFKGLQLLYPAALYNPVTVFMLPENIKKVTSIDDLKKYKGVRFAKEQFSDYVETQVEELNLLKIDSSYKVFEALFTKQVDYIIAGYYYGSVEAIKLGLLQHIAASKQVLWNIPVFIGVSKTSKNRNLISKRLTAWLNQPQNIERLKKNVEELLNELKTRYAGAVPPTFGLIKEEAKPIDNNSESVSEISKSEKSNIVLDDK